VGFYCQPCEQAMVNAWDGCAASAVAPVHKSAALFFYANKKTCQAWSRIRAFLFVFLDWAPLLFKSDLTFLISQIVYRESSIKNAKFGQEISNFSYFTWEESPKILLARFFEP
jgi:hypothetical protein